jgi:alpha-galactosidase
MNARTFGRLTVALFLVLAAATACLAAQTVAQPDKSHAMGSFVKGFVENNSLLSFVYDGQPSEKLLAKWPKKAATAKLDDYRTERTITWADPNTGLEVRCVLVQYSDFPVVEWTGYFRNTGKDKCPILEKIQALDLRLGPLPAESFVLRGIRGDDCGPTSYQPYEHKLSPNTAKTFAPAGGRPTDSAFPYFNLSCPGSDAYPGGSMIFAIGWPGQWSATFAYDAERKLHVTAGQELTHLSLRPGEMIRTPLVVVAELGKDVDRSQNLWRRWMLAHNLPRPGSKPLRPMYCFCDGGFFDGLKVSEAIEKQFIDTLGKESVKFDYWWMDAGWYSCGSWPETGTWKVDPQRFPRGIKAVSDHVHAKGAKLIVWFEPERVTGGSELAKEHPDWLLGGTLLNLGNPAARKWITDRIDSVITEQGIDLYRQDFNMAPLDFWRKNDSPDRQGMTENLHVQGYLAYWDELLRRHPGMLIDSCASGGRRNDIETLRRAVPLLRSDYQAFDGNPVYAPGNQCHTYGLSSWIPFYGQGVYYTPKDYVYCVRSHICPSFCVCVDVRKPGIDWNLYRRLIGQWRQVVDCMLGDYYPLTPYSLKEDCWMAWQFDLPEQGKGMIQVFRRTQSAEAKKSLVLKGLDPDASYEVTNLDGGTPIRTSGKDLMTDGVSVELTEKPGSALLVYKKI